MKNLVVITGAGASAGAVEPQINTQLSWGPPVTKDIFSIRFEDTLRKYETISGFAGINNNLITGADLEQTLRMSIGTHADYEKLSSTRRRQLNQFPLYLQELFTEISNLFYMTSHYREFVNLLFQRDLKITFITLNYDLLLDRAIEFADDILLTGFTDYFSHYEKWVLIKPHGSINWFRPILNIYGQTGDTFESWKAIVNNISILNDLDKSYIFHAKKLGSPKEECFENGFINRTGKKYPVYPVLAVPNGEYGLIHPVDDLRRMMEHNLQESENFLIIGMSAYATDLLNALNANVKKVNKLIIVGKNDTQQVYKRLSTSAPIFKQVNPLLYGNGFEGLFKIKEGRTDLESFLDAL